MARESGEAGEPVAVGIDTGATTTRFTDGTGTIRRMSTPEHYEQYLDLLESLLRDTPLYSHVAIAVPAVVRDGTIVAASNLHESWYGPDIGADVATRTNGRIRPLIVPDTEAAGYAARAHDASALLLTISTGLGGAWLTPDAVKTLSVGHMMLDLSGQRNRCGCGQVGCAEADLSGTAVRSRTGTPADAVDDREFWWQFGGELGRFLAVVVPLFTLERVVLMGSVCARAAWFIETARTTLRAALHYVPMPAVEVSTSLHDLGVVGAYQRALLEAERRVSRRA